MLQNSFPKFSGDEKMFIVQVFLNSGKDYKTAFLSRVRLQDKPQKSGLCTSAAKNLCSKLDYIHLGERERERERERENIGSSHLTDRGKFFFLSLSQCDLLAPA